MKAIDMDRTRDDFADSPDIVSPAFRTVWSRTSSTGEAAKSPHWFVAAMVLNGLCWLVIGAALIKLF